MKVINKDPLSKRNYFIFNTNKYNFELKIKENFMIKTFLHINKMKIKLIITIKIIK